MPFPIRTCVVCSKEFELKPDKPGFANRCPECSQTEESSPRTKGLLNAGQRNADSEVNEARREAIRRLLYSKDS
jgi:hypothetical protein